jgi:integrase
MSKIRHLLTKEYKNAYVLTYKKKYSAPKIYDADGDLSKRWYIYYSYRNPQNNILERQTPIYAGINHFKTLKERTKAAKNLCEVVASILESGFDPHDDTPIIEEQKKHNVSEAIDFVLELRKNSLKESTYKDFKSRLKMFEKWLIENGYQGKPILSLTKKTVILFLNSIALKSSTKNRNNSRLALSMFFQTLEDNDIVVENFVRKIKVLQSKPERNKTYTSSQETALFEYLKKNDALMLLFVQFVSYNHLRPIEVVRLRIKDLNIKDKTINVRAKNKAVKVKIIPEILLSSLPNLEQYKPESFVFTPNGIGCEWATGEIDKRDYFSKRFKKVKDSLGLGKDYGLYSFRHTFITKLYRELVKNSTPFEAKSKLMLITGHTTMTALEKYLRDIDAELPEDYSQHLK